MSTPPATPEDFTFARDDLLAPGTLHRPATIPADLWDRMPWPARWKATRNLLDPHRANTAAAERRAYLESLLTVDMREHLDAIVSHRLGVRDVA